MANFFGSHNKSTSINNIPVTQSSQGYPIPTVLGQNKIHSSLLLIAPFTEQAVSSGGKGGGGKGATQYNYFADVQAALCNGPVASIASVWTGQTWLQTEGTSEQITISSNYSPQNAVMLQTDNGVGIVNTYSNTYNDYGQPAATVLNGSDLAPMTQVAYNYSISPAANSSALTTGQYSISTASIGTFTLSAAANASSGTTQYTGTFSSPSGGSNGFVGFTFKIAGFSHAENNGTWVCTGSSTTTLTLANTSGISESHAATAEDIGNTYHFSSSDSGKNAQITYQFNYAFFQAQDVFLVPSGAGAPGFPNHSVVLSQQFGQSTIVSIQYYGEDNPNAGETFTSVSSTPSVAGTYQAFLNPKNAVGNTYVVFSAADAGQEVLVTWTYINESAVGSGNGAGPEQLLNFTLYGGNMGQPVNTSIETGGTFTVIEGSSSFSEAMAGAPGETLGYSGIAHVDYTPMYFGTSGQMQDNVFEVLTPDAYGAGVTDCNPVQCIYRVLTDTRWGLGSQFPTVAIDNTTSGTWGGASGTPGARQTGSTAWNWFAAQSFFISPKIDSQDTAASVMSKWLEAGTCAAFMSEGLMKLVPYGSTSAAGNGCTWKGPQDFVVALDDSCFLYKEGEDRIKIERSAWQDAYNKVQVDFDNRQHQYFDDITQDWDQAAINRFGQREEDPRSWDFIHSLAAANFAASMRVKRATSIRNSYTFSLAYAYGYLEPMDIVTINTSSIWAAGLNNTQLGITNLPVRITKIIDNPGDEGLEVTCEDYQALAHEPVLFNKGISSATSVNMFAAPGNTQAIVFEATSRLTNYIGNQMWIGACGVSSQWGSANVLVSQDGDSYINVGKITSQARIGTLVDELPAGSDPDTTDTLVVQLEENCPALDAGTTTDADYLNTMCFVDGEIIAYSACSATGQNQYTMNDYIRRGQMGSQIEAHEAGTAFMRLDTSIFKYTYDPKWAGQTIYFKFQSVNFFGNAAQDLSTLTPVTFIVPGLGPGTVDAASGIIVAQSSFNIGAGPMSGSPTATT